jgi:hypothetical protein
LAIQADTQQPCAPLTGEVAGAFSARAFSLGNWLASQGAPFSQQWSAWCGDVAKDHGVLTDATVLLSLDAGNLVFTYVPAYDAPGPVRRLSVATKGVKLLELTYSICGAVLLPRDIREEARLPITATVPAPQPLPPSKPQQMRLPASPAGLPLRAATQAIASVAPVTSVQMVPALPAETPQPQFRSRMPS